MIAGGLKRIGEALKQLRVVVIDLTHFAVKTPLACTTSAPQAAARA